ncbi:unnamed protein product, partial [Symbiodinium necroappetens]
AFKGPPERCAPAIAGMISSALRHHGLPGAAKNQVRDPWNCPQAPRGGRRVAGLDVWVSQLRLEGHRTGIAAWAADMGAASLRELAEHAEALAEALPLKPLEARRLQREGLAAAERVLAEEGFPGTAEASEAAGVEASGRRITAKAPQPVTNGKGKRGSAVSKVQLGNPGRHRPLGPGSFSSVVGGTREFFDGLGCSPRAVDLPPPARL